MIHQFCWFIWFFLFSPFKISPRQPRSRELLIATLSARNEPWAQSWDQVGHPGQRGPRHPTEGAPQVQAEADPSVQEQASKEGSPGVRPESLYHPTTSLEIFFESLLIIPFSPWQFWWWHPWNGGLRHRWVHLRCLYVFLVWSVVWVSAVFCHRHHCHLSLGGLQSPGAARAGPVRHHLSLGSAPIRSCPDSRPCSNHLPQALFSSS